MMHVRLIALLLVCVVLASCATPQRRIGVASDLQHQAERERELASHPHWGLTGKIAVSDGRDGGSGRISWQQRGDHFEIELRAPVTGRSWRLIGTPQAATLEGLEGGLRTGANAAELLQREVGWTVPVGDMVAWVRGGRGGGHSTLEFDLQARPSRLQQSGWSVEYRAWSNAPLPMPTKIFAARGEHRVRLVVERWDVAP